MTRSDVLRKAALRLAEAGLPTPELEARALAQEALGLSPTQLLADGGAEVSLLRSAQLDAFLDRRLSGEPVDRILGCREFWGLGFALSPETLSPRPDTETVVEAALAEIGDADGAISVLDLGTGSGCLLLALLSELPNAWGLGVDLSPGAANTARENAESLGLAGRARFAAGHWAAAVATRFDLLVSNPPYIATDDIAALDVEVRAHDPRRALDGGTDGLDAYRAILREAPRLLAPGGAAVLELGAGQAGAVGELAVASGLAVIRAARDLAGVERALVVRAPHRGSGK
ncbi:peptide chain release factor N(5)-glutamine methyltransferase [Hansschlegelia zhihuaiae]|uniref:peptide chain release factor N(5)-glutamine methyltransferase n=1 Tax=Hansschlegelia zhihuaiae TaxID=405005 RepID=UPI001FE04C25|nr:peptide chain release factor N(5)-glutamine methyltransferase [Hansschlegelia zhihuaiae]